MKLKEFFIDKNITYPFKLFGKTHIFLLFLIFISLILIVKNRKNLYQLNNKTKQTITKVLAFIYLTNMVILYISSFYYHNFNYQTMLPLHLCYLSNYLYIYVILFNKSNLLKYCYFLGYLGPIPAIIFFDVPSVFESFNFYLYVITHHLFLIGTTVTFYLYPKLITIKDIIKLFITLNILYFIINIFNIHYSTNYFFTMGIPNFILNLIPPLKIFPYVIILEFMIIIIIVILYKIWHHEMEHLIK